MAESKDQKPNPVRDKSFAFAKYLANEKQEYVLSKFLLNAGTLIGPYAESAQQSPDRQDFYRELGIALQHAVKPQYWLKLPSAGDYLSATEFDSIYVDADELVSLLTSIVKSAKRNP